MTIQIPGDVARGLDTVAAAQKISAEQLAVDQLRALFGRPVSPVALLEAIRALPHPSSSAVDDLDAPIAEGRLPVRAQGVFDR